MIIYSEFGLGMSMDAVSRVCQFHSIDQFVSIHWGPPRGFGEQGNKAIYFRGTREQKSKTIGNRGTKAILGNREHRKSRFWFWGTRENTDFFQWNKGRGIPPPPLPPHPGRASTVKPVLKATHIKQSPVFKGQFLQVPKMDNKCKLTCFIPSPLSFWSGLFHLWMSVSIIADRYLSQKT